MRRKYLLRIVLITWVILPMAISLSCSEKAEGIAAEETADQIEEARIAGRNEAKKFVTKNLTDTLEIQKKLLEARAVSSEYEINNDPRCKEAFDSAFISTLKTVRPDIARELQRAQANQATE